ncbi:hypothetical protein BO86DRAFT_213761 [Aspergillus japonicus CBS 114.51]|uniref:Uncharacterized protein n=1 Tax=Aspergillus japonicus CBS 114.51 TaxID=1448312 RepID=A0A8T8XA97_ASPJA|nr:hypothetical protein BO86DRAFT_213761 [Aspergillus japonicus CBS 114.51]RAH85127.1 hypothetical protein BO86DRAFT_213761 [Aspergillus japonicus CBS 114.51]
MGGGLKIRLSARRVPSPAWLQPLMHVPHRLAVAIGGFDRWKLTLRASGLTSCSGSDSTALGRIRSKDTGCGVGVHRRPIATASCICSSPKWVFNCTREGDGGLVNYLGAVEPSPFASPGTQSTAVLHAHPRCDCFRRIGAGADKKLQGLLISCRCTAVSLGS